MKKFSFGMEKILKMRMYSEQEAKLELGRAVGILSEIENNIKRVAEERIRISAKQFLSENSTNEIHQYSLYLMRLDSTKEKLLKDAALAEIKVEQAREIFIAASQERKAMDKLKEKKEILYRKKMFAEEGKTLDDLSSGAYARKLGIS